MTDPSEPTEEPSPPESIDAAGSAPSASEADFDAAPHAHPARTVGDPPDLLVPAAGLPRAASVVTSSASAQAAARPVPVLAGRRQFARTTPVVIDRGRASFGLPSFGDRRQLGQIGLVVLMVAALGAILLARLGQPSSPGVTGGGSPSAHASASSSPKASPHPTAQPSPTPGSSSPARSPGPSPSSKVKSYKVQKGDTLSSIAAKFQTTAKVIEQLNNIQSPFVIHPGETLKLP